MTLWTRANQEYNATAPCHWTQAYKDFNTLHTNYPLFGGLQQMLLTAQGKATPAECPAPSNVGGIIAGLVIVLLLLAAGAAYWYLRRTNKLEGALAAVGIKRSQTKVDQLPRQGGIDPPTQPSAPWLRSPPAPPPAAPPAYGATPTPITGIVAPYPSQPVDAPRGELVAAPYLAPAEQTGQNGEPHQIGSTNPPGPAPTTVRICAQGHAVTDRAAKFCPECGSPIPTV
jgi:hypothetical protein